MVDLTGVGKDVDECSCGGDHQRLLYFGLCMSLSYICWFLLPHETSSTFCVLALMAVSMTSVNYIYTWLFYPALCLNIMSSLVRGCLSPLLFYTLAQIFMLFADKCFHYRPNEFCVCLLSCCLCA